MPEDKLIPTGVDPNVVFDKLAGLPSVDIANFFRSERVQGRQKKSGSCPIARYLQKTTGLRVIVGNWNWHIDNDPCGNPLPESCQTFVTDFDCGYYKDLIAE